MTPEDRAIWEATEPPNGIYPTLNEYTAALRQIKIVEMIPPFDPISPNLWEQGGRLYFKLHGPKPK